MKNSMMMVVDRSSALSKKTNFRLPLSSDCINPNKAQSRVKEHARSSFLFSIRYFLFVLLLFSGSDNQL